MNTGNSPLMSVTISHAISSGWQAKRLREVSVCGLVLLAALTECSSCVLQKRHMQNNSASLQVPVAKSQTIHSPPSWVCRARTLPIGHVGCIWWLQCRLIERLNIVQGLLLHTKHSQGRNCGKIASGKHSMLLSCLRSRNGFGRHAYLDMFLSRQTDDASTRSYFINNEQQGFLVTLGRTRGLNKIKVPACGLQLHFESCRM